MKRLPKYKKGGNTKTDFISEKTAYLISKEGMKADQAYAVANSMYQQQYKQVGGGFQLPKPQINTVGETYDLTGLEQNPNFNPSPTFNIDQGKQIIEDNNIYDNKQTSRDKRMLKQYAWDSANGAWGDNPQNQNYKQQFFDVYGGIDIPTSAYTLGEGIQTGNALEIAGSGLKLLTGLGRNAFAGAGNAKRNEYIQKDAQEKYRDSLTPDAQSFQMGGTSNSVAPQMPVKNILYNVRTEGIREGNLEGGYYTRVDYENGQKDYLTSEGLRNFKNMSNYRQFIEKQGKKPNTKLELAYNTPSFQMGGEMMPPPQEIDPNQVAEALQQGADPNEVLQMLVQSGMSQEQAVQLIQQIMQQLQGQPTEEAVMQDGGKYKALTGEYTIEQDRLKEEDVVAELESREFLKTPTQEITQIDGSTHERGGVKLTEEQIPDGSEVISDHLKLTKDQVKSFSEKYDLKLSTKDTYADILHKWNKKSGLDENVKEQEDLIKQIEKQVKLLEEKPEAETTINLNIDLLQKELAELEQEKAPLEEERKAVFNEVFKAQESQKPKEDTDKMQDGGMFNGDMVISYAKKHNINPDRAMELVNMYKNGGYKQYQDGSKFFTPSKWAKQKYENQPYIAGLTTASGELDDTSGILERMTDQSQKLPYLSKRVNLLDGRAANLGSIGKFQPGYDEYVDTTNVEIDNNPYLSAKEKEEYKKIATAQKLSLSNKQGNYDAIYGEETSTRQPFKLPYLTTEDRKKYPNLSYIGDAFDDKGNIKPEFESLDAKTKDLLKSTYKRQGVKAFDIQLGEVGKPTTTTDSNNVDNTAENTPFNGGNKTQTRMGIMALPDQYAPLPDALQGNLKLEYRPNLVDKQNVTAEPIIAEIRRQEQSAMQAIQNLPDAQRAASIAQVQANTQDQINKVMNQVQGQNLQSDIQVGNANAQTLNQAQDINNRYTLDFEGKILKADALTRNDIRNWMNHNQAVNLANSNAINKLNYYNQLSEYNQITPNGIEMTSSPTLNYGNMSDVQKARVREQVLADEEKKQLKAQKKTETKKNGGRIKRKL
jgi:hypothetical protein